MEHEHFKAPTLTKQSMKPPASKTSSSKRRKAREKFLRFCDIVLSYTKYEQMKQQENALHHRSPPFDSEGSTVESFSEESHSPSMFPDEDSDSLDFSKQHFISGSSKVKERTEDRTSSSDESSEEITCFCLKPFGGRPMIECSRCNTWIHLSCAKIRRTNIPDVYICQVCKDAKTKKRKSGRMRSEKQLLDM